MQNKREILEDIDLALEEIEKQIDAGIRDGDLEVVGVDDNNERIIALTEKGRKFVESVLSDSSDSPTLN